MAWLYGVIAIIVLLLVFRRGQEGLSSVVTQVVKARDIGPFLLFVQGVPETRRPAIFLEGIEDLWGRWERALGARLIRELVLSYPDEKLGQFWLQKVMEVEPEIAEEELGEEFLLARYKPEVAACCGAVG